MNNLNIRPMQSTDVPAVSAIEQQAFPYPWGEQAFYDCLRVDFKCWVMELEQKIIGYAIVMAVLDESQLLNIAIASDQRGKQAGKYLLSWIVAQLKVTGTKEMFLEVRESNLTAIHLYETLDFQKVGVRKAYYPCDNNRREDAILYKKIFKEP